MICVCMMSDYPHLLDLSANVGGQHEILFASGRCLFVSQFLGYSRSASMPHGILWAAGSYLTPRHPLDTNQSFGWKFARLRPKTKPRLTRTLMPIRQVALRRQLCIYAHKVTGKHQGNHYRTLLAGSQEHLPRCRARPCAACRASRICPCRGETSPCRRRRTCSCRSSCWPGRGRRPSGRGCGGRG